MAVKEARSFIIKSAVKDIDPITTVKELSAIADKHNVPYNRMIEEAVDFPTESIDGTYRLAVRPGVHLGPIISEEEYKSDPDFGNKFERCILKTAKTQPDWCLKEKAWGKTRAGRTCYSPFAICRATLREARGIPKASLRLYSEGEDK